MGIRIKTAHPVTGQRRSPGHSVERVASIDCGGSPIDFAVVRPLTVAHFADNTVGRPIVRFTSRSHGTYHPVRRV